MTSTNKSEYNFNINETEVGVLKKNPETGEIFIDFIKIDRVLNNDFDTVLLKVESSNYIAKDIAVFVKSHSKLHVLLSDFDYCRILGMPWENGLPDLSPHSSAFNKVLQVLIKIAFLIFYKII